MNVTYSDSAKENKEEFALLEQATKRLEEVRGHSDDLVTAEWDRRQDQHRQPVYTLRLSDWSGTVSASFTPEELRARVLLYRLLGKLLQARVDKQLQALGDSGE